MNKTQETPVQFSELRSGMRLWDSRDGRWQNVLRVYLWADILKKHPNRYFTSKQK